MSTIKEEITPALNKSHKDPRNGLSSNVDPLNGSEKGRDVELLSQAEASRRAINSEILAKLAEINNPLIDHDSIRIINANIANLERKRFYWEHRIVKLGGMNYLKVKRSVGVKIRGSWYYGRGKELPEAKKDSKREPTPRSNISHARLLNPLVVREFPRNYSDILAQLNSKSHNKLTENVNHDNKFSIDQVEGWLINKKKQHLILQIKNTR